MGTQIQEPNQIEDSHVTDENAGNIAIVCYEKSQENAGLKRLGLAKWKQFLNYNGYKVDNIATLLGISKSEYDKNEEIPEPVPPNYTMRQQLQDIADKLGETLDPPGSSYVTYHDRVDSLETKVGDDNSGLVKDMAQAQQDITNLENEVGSGGGSGPNLFERMQTAETDIDNLEKTVYTEYTPESGSGADDYGTQAGLVKQVYGYEESGTKYDGMHNLRDKVNTLKTNVGDNNSGLTKAVNDNRTDIDSLDDTVNNSSTGLVQYVEILNKDVETGWSKPVPSGKNSQGLLERVGVLETTAKNVYQNKGSITQQDVNNWDWEKLKTGFVYDIAETETAGVTITIPVTTGDSPVFTVYPGDNIVFIEDTDGIYEFGYFDVLGNTSRIDKLEDDVTDLKTDVGEKPAEFTGSLFSNVTELNNRKYLSANTWSSTSENGTYIISGRNPENKTFCFIISFSEGTVPLSSNIIQLGDLAFNTLFNQDTSSFKISSKPNVNVNVLKIGDN